MPTDGFRKHNLDKIVCTVGDEVVGGVDRVGRTFSKRDICDLIAERGGGHDKVTAEVFNADRDAKFVTWKEFEDRRSELREDREGWELKYGRPQPE